MLVLGHVGVNAVDCDSQLVLIGQSQPSQVLFGSGKYVSHFVMIVLQRSFLVVSHRVAIEYRASEGAIGFVFKMIGVGECRSPVGEDTAYVPAKHLLPQYLLFKKVESVNNVLRCIGVMVHFQQQAKINELERLHERTVCLVGIDAIHLKNGCIRIVGHVLLKDVIGASVEIGTVIHFLVGMTALLGPIPSCLASQGSAVYS